MVRTGLPSVFYYSDASEYGKGLYAMKIEFVHKIVSGPGMSIHCLVFQKSGDGKNIVGLCVVINEEEKTFKIETLLQPCPTIMTF